MTKRIEQKTFCEKVSKNDENGQNLEKMGVQGTETSDRLKFRIKPSKATEKPKSLVGVKTPKVSKQRAEKIAEMTSEKDQSEASDDPRDSASTVYGSGGV